MGGGKTLDLEENQKDEKKKQFFSNGEEGEKQEAAG